MENEKAQMQPCETCSHWQMIESDDRPDVAGRMDYEEMYADAKCERGVAYPEDFDFHDKMTFGCSLHSEIESSS